MFFRDSPDLAPENDSDADETEETLEIFEIFDKPVTGVLEKPIPTYIDKTIKKANNSIKSNNKNNSSRSNNNNNNNNNDDNIIFEEEPSKNVVINIPNNYDVTENNTIKIVRLNSNNDGYTIFNYNNKNERIDEETSANSNSSSNGSRSSVDGFSIKNPYPTTSNETKLNKINENGAADDDDVDDNDDDEHVSEVVDDEDDADDDESKNEYNNIHTHISNSTNTNNRTKINGPIDLRSRERTKIAFDLVEDLETGKTNLKYEV